MGCNLGLSPESLDNMVPTPVSNASTSVINCLFALGCFRIGAEVNTDFNLPPQLLCSRRVSLAPS